jgi:hypothetical protein
MFPKGAAIVHSQSRLTASLPAQTPIILAFLYLIGQSYAAQNKNFRLWTTQSRFDKITPL